jgi:hypothetical protein
MNFFIIRLSCTISGTTGNQSSIIDYAREQLAIYLTDPSVSVIWAICAIVAHHASDMDLNNLFQLWEQCSRREYRLRCAYGLSYVQNSSHLERVFEFFAHQSSTNHNNCQTLRLQYLIKCYKGFCLSRQGREYYLEYMENHWLSLRANHTDEYLEALIRETFRYFASENEAQRIEQLFLVDDVIDSKTKTPSTPCTRIAVHLSLDDQELSTLTRTDLLSPSVASRSFIPTKVRDVASSLVHTTRTRAMLLERNRDKLLKYFQSDLFVERTSSTSTYDKRHDTQMLPSCLSTSPTNNGHKRKRRLSSLTTNHSSPPVRNLLASDATA